MLALVVYRDTCAAFKRTANILIQGFSVEVLKRVLCQALSDRNMLEIFSLLLPLLNSDGFHRTNMMCPKQKYKIWNTCNLVGGDRPRAISKATYNKKACLDYTHENKINSENFVGLQSDDWNFEVVLSTLSKLYPLVSAKFQTSPLFWLIGGFLVFLQRAVLLFFDLCFQQFFLHRCLSLIVLGWVLSPIMMMFAWCSNDA